MRVYSLRGLIGRQLQIRWGMEKMKWKWKCDIISRLHLWKSIAYEGVVTYGSANIKAANSCTAGT